MTTLFVATGGGHLEELRLLEPRFYGLDEDRVWITTDSPQTRSLLAGQQRLFVPWTKPRDARGTLTGARLAYHVLALADWTNVVSTGSLPAVPFLTLARARGIPCHYIESAARVTSPSLTAKILRTVPGLHCYSQYRWAHRPAWKYRGSVFDSFVRTRPANPEVQRVVVTLGTNNYDFSRLVAALLKALPSNADVLWQTGATDVSHLPIEGRRFVPEDELFEAMCKADVVVAHAGAGSALTALRSGHCPILVPRRLAYGEHVDDHQHEIAAELARRHLAVAAEADELTPATLERAARATAVVDGAAPPFELDFPGRRPGPMIPLPRALAAQGAA